MLVGNICNRNASINLMNPIRGRTVVIGREGPDGGGSRPIPIKVAQVLLQPFYKVVFNFHRIVPVVPSHQPCFAWKSEARPPLNLPWLV